MARNKKSTKRKTYSKGEMNRFVDALIHPLYEKNQSLRLVDGVIHAIIEQNPRSSAEKFLRYNLRELGKKILGVEG